MMFLKGKKLMKHFCINKNSAFEMTHMEYTKCNFEKAILDYNFYFYNDSFIS